MELKRSSGILLHITSLPSSFGIGDIGPAALRFIDWLEQAGQSWWQILPLGLPAQYNSPYLAQSSWAGSPLFVSLDLLARAGDLTPAEIRAARVPDSAHINYRRAAALRDKLLPLAARRFFTRSKTSEIQHYRRFCRRNQEWLDDWAVFSSARRVFKSLPWWRWPSDLAGHNRRAIQTFSTAHPEELACARYIQFRFYEQWENLREYAAKHGIKLIGDVPIYTAADSADVWASPRLFKLQADGQPRCVSGVPPDYFSRTGQLWGHPVYDWKLHRTSGFKWWISRLRAALEIADIVRIDHFRGLEAYWEIPAPARNAIKGRWVKGPGEEFLKAVYRSLGNAPFIAEDLGVITPGVNKLKTDWNLPGMQILQFAFGGNPRKNIHLPHLNARHSVVYTGTHDNDTSLGWYRKAPAEQKRAFRAYTGCNGEAPHQAMIRAAFSSPAALAVIPVQDVLGLGSEARLNRPGINEGIYLWKLVRGQLTDRHAKAIRDCCRAFGR